MSDSIEDELQSLKDSLAESQMIQNALYRITEIASETDSLSDFYKAIHLSIKELMYADNLYIVLFNEDKNELQFVYFVDTEDDVNVDELLSLPEQISEKSMTGYLLESGQMVHRSKKEMLEMRLQGIIQFHGPAAIDWLGVPLKYKEKTLGALVVQSYNREFIYKEREEKILQFVCRQIALVLKRKQSEQALFEINSKLEETIEIRTSDLVKSKEAAEFANKSKSEFLANVTHELRTPMHAILSFSSQGIKKTNDGDIARLGKYFERINQSGARLLEFVNDILDLSKLEAGKQLFSLDENDLMGVLNEAIQQLEFQFKEKNITIDIKTDKNLQNGYFDKSSIHQVITNLLANAIKFSPNNARVYIQILHASMVLGRRETDREEQPALCFSIEDEGIGIPANELDSVFDMFIQSSHTDTGAGGTGLGLAISKEIINNHHGKIWAENSESRGAKFYFIIPASGY
ncbi:MAG TPA: GAF domain-containing sensor histidine kinase [Aeromonadales bacterium]|nr:GAF domain-containing sensor histidine kinase [Aeromonadales bacterium]